MRLCLIRHLPPDVPPGVCYGQTDLALKDPASAVADALPVLRTQLAAMLPEGAPVFASPLQRCLTLANALSSNVIEEPRLRELNFGSWEMRAWDEIGPEALDAWAANIAGFRPPGGETGDELQARALDWLRESSQQHGYAIVITHAGVMRALQAHHQQLPGADWLRLRYDFGQLLCLDFTLEQIHASPVQ